MDVSRLIFVTFSTITAKLQLSQKKERVCQNDYQIIIIKNIEFWYQKIHRITLCHMHFIVDVNIFDQDFYLFPKFCWQLKIYNPFFNWGLTFRILFPIIFFFQFFFFSFVQMYINDWIIPTMTVLEWCESFTLLACSMHQQNIYLNSV